MILHDINGKAFIDANIFLYPVLDDLRYGESSSRFLKRIHYGDIIGFTSVLVLNEVLHKLMISEIAKRYTISFPEALRYVKSNPDVISELEKSWDDIRWIKSIRNLTIFDITAEIADLALKYSKDLKLLSRKFSYGKFLLLCNQNYRASSDGIHVATMQTHRLTNLASNDSDFERVNWIKLYKPKKQ